MNIKYQHDQSALIGGKSVSSAAASTAYHMLA